MYNKTKTILFALIAVMILTIGGMNYAEAVNENANDKAKEKVKDNDKIPEDKLLKRNDNWKSEYPNDEKFEKAEESIKGYVNDQHPDNKWNKTTKKNQIIVYNFDTNVGKLHAGLNALLSDVEDQKSNGVYSPTEAERKFHEYADTLVPNPIMPDAKQKHVDKVIAALNENANYGNVHPTLVESDVEFWVGISTDKTCELLPDCDPSIGEIIPVIGLIPFVQFAQAETWSTYHVLKVTVEANSCYEGSGCYYSHSSSGNGELSSGTSSTNHSSGQTIQYTINDKSYVDNYDVSHNISGGSVSLGSSSSSIASQSGTDSVTISGSNTFSVTCGSSHCGTFGISAQADAATFET